MEQVDPITAYFIIFGIGYLLGSMVTWRARDPNPRRKASQSYRRDRRGYGRRY